jgi:hypothetical protein
MKCCMGRGPENFCRAGVAEEDPTVLDYLTSAAEDFFDDDAADQEDLEEVFEGVVPGLRDIDGLFGQVGCHAKNEKTAGPSTDPPWGMYPSD